MAKVLYRLIASHHRKKEDMLLHRAEITLLSGPLHISRMTSNLDRYSCFIILLDWGWLKKCRFLKLEITFSATVILSRTTSNVRRSYNKEKNQIARDKKKPEGFTTYMFHKVRPLLEEECFQLWKFVIRAICGQWLRTFGALLKINSHLLSCFFSLSDVPGP